MGGSRGRGPNNLCANCCGPTPPTPSPYVTHRKIAGGPTGGAKVWDADRGAVNGLPVSPPSSNQAFCWGVRVDDTQIYTAGGRVKDLVSLGSLTAYQTIYITQTPATGLPSYFTLVLDPTASGVFVLSVFTPSGTGTTLPIACTATATDVGNAILATCADDLSETAVVSPGDFTVSGGPLPTNPIVVTLSGLAGTNSGIQLPADTIGTTLTSPYRNTAEAWTKDGVVQWATSLPGGSRFLMVDGGNAYLTQDPVNYFNNCTDQPIYPAYVTTGSGSSRTLQCWDGTPPGFVADKTTHPDPVAGYFMLLLSWTDGTTTDKALTPPLPFGATASDVQTALRALVSAGHGTGLITCAGGALPGTAISVTLPTLPGGQAWTFCTVTDTLTGGNDNGVALRMLSATDGSLQASNAYGLVNWGNFVGSGPYYISKRSSTVYVTGTACGGNPSDQGVSFPGCRGDGPRTRTFDASFSPLGDLAGSIGDGAWCVCFDSSGNCYSASDSGVLKIGSDFNTGGLAFNVSGTHLTPAGAVALLSDSVLVATWSNQIGTFNTSDGSNIANATLPDAAAPGSGRTGLQNEICVDSNGLIYVTVGARSSGFTDLPGCVACYDSSLSLLWTHDYRGGDGTLGAVQSVCCEPDGSYVYFGGSRIPV